MIDALNKRRLSKCVASAHLDLVLAAKSGKVNLAPWGFTARERKTVQQADSSTLADDSAYLQLSESTSP
eukprot:6476352-Amphidinium_carterae.1